MYGPNLDAPETFHRFFTKLYGEPQIPSAIVGDFNKVLDPFVDKSQPQGHKSTKIRTALELQIKDLGLCET